MSRKSNKNRNDSLGLPRGSWGRFGTRVGRRERKALSCLPLTYSAVPAFPATTPPGAHSHGNHVRSETSATGPVTVIFSALFHALFLVSVSCTLARSEVARGRSAAIDKARPYTLLLPLPLPGGGRTERKRSSLGTAQDWLDGLQRAREGVSHGLERRPESAKTSSSTG